MLRVTIELIPQGDERRKCHLGTAEIVNDGSGTNEIGNYKVRLSKWGNPSETWKYGELRGFPRQNLGAWDLLSLCLVAAIGDRLRDFRNESTEGDRE